MESNIDVRIYEHEDGSGWDAVTSRWEMSAEPNRDRSWTYVLHIRRGGFYLPRYVVRWVSGPHRGDAIAHAHRVCDALLFL
jgi:hypothetical protein